MKIRLLENVRHHHLQGSRGEVIDVPDDVAVDLEKHGAAAFLPEESEPAINESEAEDLRDESLDEPEVNDGESVESGKESELAVTEGAEESQTEKHPHHSKAKAKKAK